MTARKRSRNVGLIFGLGLVAVAVVVSFHSRARRKKSPSEKVAFQEIDRDVRGGISRVVGYQANLELRHERMDEIIAHHQLRIMNYVGAEDRPVEKPAELESSLVIPLVRELEARGVGKSEVMAIVAGLGKHFYDEALISQAKTKGNTEGERFLRVRLLKVAVAHMEVVRGI